MPSPKPPPPTREAPPRAAGPSRLATLLALAALATTTGAGCLDQNSGPSLGDPLLDRGQAAFRRFCVECHGVAGDGRGPAAKFQPKPPRSFITEGFRFRWDAKSDRAVDAERGTVTEDDLFRTVTEGLPNSTMPAFAPLPPDERFALVAYVRYLARQSVSPGRPPAPLQAPAGSGAPAPPAPRAPSVPRVPSVPGDAAPAPSSPRAP